MKITVTEEQARKVKDVLVKADGVLKDNDLVDVFGQLTDGLDQARRNPMLTADELAAAVDVLEGWLAAVPQAIVLPEHASQVKAQVKTGLPKLRAMQRKQAQVEAARQRTPGLDPAIFEG